MLKIETFYQNLILEECSTLCFIFINDLLLMSLSKTKIKGKIKKEKYCFFSNTMQEVAIWVQRKFHVKLLGSCWLKHPSVQAHSGATPSKSPGLEGTWLFAESTEQAPFGLNCLISFQLWAARGGHSSVLFGTLPQCGMGNFVRGIQTCISRGCFIPLLSVFLLFNF